MIKICKNCQSQFECIQIVNGVKAKLHKRQFCLKCSPYKTHFYGKLRTSMKYNIDDLKQAIKNSFSLRQVLLALKLREAGGNYSTLNKLIQEHNIDISHFKKQGWNKGKIIGYSYPTEDYLLNKRSIHSHKLKQRLIKENYFEYKCYHCNLIEWQNQPIPLQLHHINGNKFDNTLSNIIILCPNCHALTPNYCGRNVKKLPKIKHPKYKKPTVFAICTDCQKQCCIKATRCKSCAGKLRMQKTCKRPSKEQLILDIQSMNNNMCAIGRKYGVSDNAVRKWLRYYCITSIWY